MSYIINFQHFFNRGNFPGLFGTAHYIRSDGYEVFIRPNGEVGYLAPEKIGSNGKKYHPRLDANGNTTTNHNTGIFVESLEEILQKIKGK